MFSFLSLSPNNIRASSRSCNYLFKRFSSNVFTKVVTEDGVRTIRLSDVKTRNSLTLDMIKSILEGVTRKDQHLRSIVITGLPPVFSSGFNLKELAVKDGSDVFQEMNKLMRAITDCEVPVIAAVDGTAAAAGLQLVAQCDFAICTERSRFSTPGIDFGIFCTTPGVALARKVPRSILSYMLYTGFPITPEQALNAGLVCHISKDDKLDDDILEITSAISEKSKAVVTHGKRFFNKQVEMDLHSAYAAGAEAMLENLRFPDAVEGIKSFIEKRKPNWTHSK